MGGNNNPTGKGGFKRGQTGNPLGGRLKSKNFVLSAEARKWSELALSTLVEICSNAKASNRDRLTAADMLLNRGHGKPRESLDLLTVGRRLSELSNEELQALEARISPTAEPQTDTQEPLH